MSKLTPSCPLCAAPKSKLFLHDPERDYYHCQTCDLVFVPSDFFLDPDSEKKRYDQHQNSPEDAGYRDFLNRLMQPLIQKVPKGSRGLDFGAGPGPTLEGMLREAGYEMDIFDLYYAPEEDMLQRNYDFITATEVVEHLREPGVELDRLWDCLRPGGWLGIMTSLRPVRELFERWYYKNDPTHICFYSRKTFEWLAARWQARLEFAGDGVILLGKPPKK